MLWTISVINATIKGVAGEDFLDELEVGMVFWEI